MSDQVSFSEKLYSSRWGRDDVYRFIFNYEQMIINSTGTKFICSWSDNGESEWFKDGSISREHFESSLENDWIYPPTVFIEALQYAWMAWRDGRLDDQAVKQEMHALCDWVYVVTQNKPRTDFWKTQF